MLIRNLDIDDLLLLSYLSDGKSITETALILNMCQPAASQRVRKMRRTFSDKIFTVKNKRLELTRIGKSLSEAAKASIRLLMSAIPYSRG